MAPTDISQDFPLNFNYPTEMGWRLHIEYESGLSLNMKTYEEKLTIVRSFRGLRFNEKVDGITTQSIRTVARTIKDYSQRHVDTQQSKRCSLAIGKRGSSQLSTAAKMPWQSTRGSLADTTVHLTSSGNSGKELSPLQT